MWTDYCGGGGVEGRVVVSNPEIPPGKIHLRSVESVGWLVVI